LVDEPFSEKAHELFILKNLFVWYLVIGLFGTQNWKFWDFKI